MEELKHWAKDLQTGDRVTATIRHPSDGFKNRFKVPLIVISVHQDTIIASDNGKEISVRFNELNHP